MPYALEPIRPMPGGTQPVLMRCSDGFFYVVKPSNNLQAAQAGRILVNDFFGSRLAAMVGLPVPPCAVIEVSSEIIAHSRMLRIQFGMRRGKTFPWKPGPHFGSRYPGDPARSHVLRLLPSELLPQVENLDDFVGILCLDKVCGHADGRQAIFMPSPFGGTYRVVFIDQGFYFGAEKWQFHVSARCGLYERPHVYATVRSLSSFEPWLARINAKWDAEAIASIAREIPTAWYDHDSAALAQIAEQLQSRPALLPHLLRQTVTHARSFFPCWAG